MLSSLEADQAIPHAHGFYIPQVENEEGNDSKNITDKALDAYFGIATTQSERDLMDDAYRTRLGNKSGEGFIADLKLAGKDLVKRQKVGQ